MADASPSKRATALAHPNLALVKYWGKRDRTLNLPVTGSLSVTLGGFTTRTTVQFGDGPGPDAVMLCGKSADGGTTARVSRLLDLVRAEAGIQAAAEVVSVNDFPTDSGLASSSSGFAALALAGCAAAGLEPNPSQLSMLARRGSGSGARSVFGGFVEMLPGKRCDGLDSVASQLYPESYWGLRVLVALTTTETKAVGSGEAMEVTAATSPYYGEWIRGNEADMDAARAALARRDLGALGEVAEHSALKMHAATMASRPGILYWRAGTVEVIHAVRRLRKDGIQAYFTIDAGPHVKVLCSPDVAEVVEKRLLEIPEVIGILKSGVGGEARLLSDIPPGWEEARWDHGGSDTLPAANAQVAMGNDAPTSMPMEGVVLGRSPLEE